MNNNFRFHANIGKSSLKKYYSLTLCSFCKIAKMFLVIRSFKNLNENIFIMFTGNSIVL